MKARWMPRDRDRVSRMGMASLVAIAACGIVVYGAPDWVVSLLPGRPALPEVFRYDDGFAGSQLPWLLAVWAMQGALFAALAVGGRWTKGTRRMDLALSLVLVVLFAWFIGSDIMLTAESDEFAKRILAVAMVFVVFDIGVKLYRSNERIARPPKMDRVSL